MPYRALGTRLLYVSIQYPYLLFLFRLHLLKKRYQPNHMLWSTSHQVTKTLPFFQHFIALLLPRLLFASYIWHILFKILPFPFWYCNRYLSLIYCWQLSHVVPHLHGCRLSALRSPHLLSKIPILAYSHISGDNNLCDIPTHFITMEP